MKLIVATILLFMSVLGLNAQPCTNPGQTPGTAFPVCGTTTFHQVNVPICVSHDLYVPGCSDDGAGYADKNPFWYKFTCYQTGSLGFLIKPNDSDDDYDWQLYDITGHDPNDVFTDKTLVVTGNWAGTYGNTGASASGLSTIGCASDPAAKKNSFSAMPQLKEGHTYLLLVSHFTDSQSGYDLSFGGGTAVITDPKIPHFQSADANCAGDLIHLKLNKPIKCTSLELKGSDFLVAPGNMNVISVKGIGCDTGFDTDSIEIKLSGPLSPGTYTIEAKKGTDNNSLVDFCDNMLPVGEKIEFKVYPKLPTPMDSLAKVTCSPQELHLIFRKPILCSSIAKDGSDFQVKGSYPVQVIGAQGTCGGELETTREIIVLLDHPLQKEGDFTITLKIGIDGSSIIDECGSETPSGASLRFSVKDTVNADFTYSIGYACIKDTVHYFHPGGNAINSWRWKLDESILSSEQNPTALYSIFNTKNIELIVSNGFCSDTSNINVDLDNYMKSDFSVPEDNCPNEPTLFTSTAIGNRVSSYNWTFGDGYSSKDQSPSHIYGVPSRNASYLVTFTITDDLGCQQTAQKKITVYSSCYLAVPNAFTPNGDGNNDFLRPLNAVKAENLDFRVYNRWGQLVYQSNNWKTGWDGKCKGIPQQSGVYVWFLHFTDRDSHQVREMKGTAALIR